MTQVELTPVERGALLILMSEGRPLRERADLIKRHGLSFNRKHREKLCRLRYINTISSKPLTHELTEEGWRWAEKEITLGRPKGQIGLGPLYAVLNGLDQYIKRRQVQLKEIFKGVDRADGHDADEALAAALQDIPVFQKSMDRLRQAAPSDLEKLIKQADLAAKLVFQSLRLAASKRELGCDIEPGQKTKYDPVAYQPLDVAEGEEVIVRKPAIMRGPIEARVVIAKGEVVPLK